MGKGDPSLTDQVDDLDRLTERERECLRLVDRHMSSKEIARELGLSKHTVDWHLDKARRRLGAADRYDAARRLFDRGSRDAAPGPGVPSGSPPPIASGSDPARLGDPPLSRSPDGVEQGAYRAGTYSVSEGRDRPGDPHSSGRDQLPERLAPPEHGRAVAPDHLGRAGAPIDEPFGLPDGRGDGARSGGGHAQAGPVQAFGTGAAGDPLHRQRGDGRDVPVGLRQLFAGLGWGRPNRLSLPLRLAFIAAVMVLTALAFGSILAGLHALEGLL
ncbi:MAG: helix-turn-helix transcriptional regulator [Caulobacter sp.]|nr:helix-turn-helix transcriptional regulator [Caulobacter sp.]